MTLPTTPTEKPTVQVPPVQPQTPTPSGPGAIQEDEKRKKELVAKQEEEKRQQKEEEEQKKKKKEEEAKQEKESKEKEAALKKEQETAKKKQEQETKALTSKSKKLNEKETCLTTHALRGKHTIFVQVPLNVNWKEGDAFQFRQDGPKFRIGEIKPASRDGRVKQFVLQSFLTEDVPEGTEIRQCTP